MPDPYQVLAKRWQKLISTLGGVSKQTIQDHFSDISSHYRTGNPAIDFTNAWARTAYSILYVPAGLDAYRDILVKALQYPDCKAIPPVFGQFARGGDLTVVSLGAGPGTEFLALIEMFGGGLSRSINCHAFDEIVEWEEDARDLIDAWATDAGRSCGLNYHQLGPANLGQTLDNVLWPIWDSPSIVTALRFCKWIPDPQLKLWFDELAARIPDDTIVIVADADGGANSAKAKHAVVEASLVSHFPNTTSMLATKQIPGSNMRWQVPDRVKAVATAADAHPPLKLDLVASAWWVKA